MLAYIIFRNSCFIYYYLQEYTYIRNAVCLAYHLIIARYVAVRANAPHLTVLYSLIYFILFLFHFQWKCFSI